MHEHYFGAITVSSTVIVCPCGGDQFAEKSLQICEAMEEFVCLGCGKSVFVSWGLTEPDHLSLLQFTSFCPHHLCQSKKAIAA